MPSTTAATAEAVTTVSAVVLSGLISGQMLAIGLADHAVRQLPEASWTLRFQEENKLFTKTMPPSTVLPIIGLGASAILTTSTPRVLFGTAAALEAVVLVVTLAVEVPMNNEVDSWKAGSAPSTWTAVRDRWLAYHWLRTALGACAFTLATVGLAMRSERHP